MKYVIFDFLTSIVPIIFPEQVNHVDIEKMVKSVYPGVKTKSAGFVKMNGEEAYCYGYSSTLKLKSDPDDKLYINMMLRD